VGYGVSEGGSENATLHVVQTADGTILPDTIDRAKYVGVTGWRPDGKSFYYMRFPKLAPGESPNDSELRPVSYLHTLGSDPDKDPAVFGIGVDPSLPFVPTDFPIVVTSPNSPYALGDIGHGVQNEHTLFVAPLDSVTGARVPWKKVADVADDVTGADVEGSTVYLLTHKDAPTYKIVATNLAAPDVAQAQTVVPASNAIIEALSGAKDGLYVRARRGGFGQIQRVSYGPDFSPGTQTTTVTLPVQGAIGTLATDPRVPGATFDLVSWTMPQRYFDVAASGTVTDTGLRPPSTIDTSDYTSEEALATSADGTKVPLSLVYRKDLVRDGTHPAYLEGYGSYGITIEPYFLGTRFAWLDQGGVWAVCHPRGGGWFGEDWHRAGMISTKQHTIDDFIACGRYLVAQKYTSSQRLAGEGTSAGGITIGRSITEAPGLFAAALDVVGVSDAVRSEFSPNGPPNVPEFGSVKVAADVAPLLNMDAYLHVVDGTKYPAVMLNTGINDPRVSPWELAKFAARLQSASTSGRPVLLRVDYDAGHGFLDTSRAQAEGLLADQFSFLLWQLGDPLFASIPQRIVVPKRINRRVTGL
jgi:prolyl oligopeptidase